MVVKATIFNPFQLNPRWEPAKLWGSRHTFPAYSTPNPWGGGGYPSYPNFDNNFVRPYGGPDDDGSFARNKESRDHLKNFEYKERTGPKS